MNYYVPLWHGSHFSAFFSAHSESFYLSPWRTLIWLIRPFHKGQLYTWRRNIATSLFIQKAIKRLYFKMRMRALHMMFLFGQYTVHNDAMSARSYMYRRALCKLIFPSPPATPVVECRTPLQRPMKSLAQREREWPDAARFQTARSFFSIVPTTRPSTKEIIQKLIYLPNQR